MTDERDELNNDLDIATENVDYTEFYNEDKGKKGGNKKIILLIPIAVILCVICVITAIIVERMTPSKEYANLYDYYGVEEGSVSVIWDGILVDEAIKIENTYYLELSFVQENFDNKFYYDESLNKLLYTTLEEIYTISFADMAFLKGDEVVSCDYYVAVRQDEEIFVALDFIEERVKLTTYVLNAPDRIVIVSDGVKVNPVEFSEDAKIRVKDSIKGKILANPLQEEIWYAIDSKVKSGWVSVASKDGRRGFVEKKSILKTETEVYEYNSGYTEPEYKGNQRDYEILMVWHAIYKVEDNALIEDLLANSKGVTTVSPTWYKVKDESGELISMADKDYVNYIHSLGMEVWPLVSDFTNVEGEGWSVKELLSNAQNRRALIENLINEVLTLECEGINIDFEYIRADNGTDYAQFIRELSIRCREEGIVLSTDNPPPKPYNQQYNFKVLGEFVDYVMIMGYDEYTKASGTPGPVASINYVSEGIEEALKMIPNDKLINGVPFYTRLWMEYVDEQGNEVFDVKTCTMENVWSTVEKLGTTPVWNDELKLYEVFADINGIHYSMWLEEETAMEERMKLVRENNLAGVSAWALGMELDSIWDVINESE